jgi:hypothetical protein
VGPTAWCCSVTARHEPGGNLAAQISIGPAPTLPTKIDGLLLLEGGGPRRCRANVRDTLAQ